MNKFKKYKSLHGPTYSKIFLFSLWTYNKIYIYIYTSYCQIHHTLSFQHIQMYKYNFKKYIQIKTYTNIYKNINNYKKEVVVL